MDKNYYSKNNVDKLAKYLEKYIPVKKTEKSQKTFRKFLLSEMENVFNLFAHKKPPL